MFGTAITPVATDTVLPKLPHYFRENPDTHKTEMNKQINPSVTSEEWVEVPLRTRRIFADAENTSTVGDLITSYTTEANAVDSWIQMHDNLKHQAFDAIRIIGERLIRESNDRGWCSEFDEIIDDVNASLPGPFALPTRERDFVVSWTEQYTVTVRRSATVTARDEDSACDMASEMYSGEADEYEMRNAVNDGDYEFSDDNSDFEAEEA
jgi:hypothetical protein